MDEVYKNYLVDLISIYREKANEALKVYREQKGTDDGDYYKGQLFSFYDILTTLKTQAAAFQIPENDIGLDSVRPERYLS